MITLRPRPRNAAVTREAIAAAARERFSRHSYDDVGMRDVAGDVGLDAALISRYFGSKEDLFAAVLDSCEPSADLLSGPRESFGARVADQIVFDPKQGDKLRGMQIMLRSIGSAKAAEVVRNSANANFFGPFSEWLGGPDAVVRVRIIAGLMMGLAVSRELGGGFGLDEEGRRSLRDRLAASIQALVDDGGQAVPERASVG